MAGGGQRGSPVTAEQALDQEEATEMPNVCPLRRHSHSGFSSVQSAPESGCLLKSLILSPSHATPSSPPGDRVAVPCQASCPGLHAPSRAIFPTAPLSTEETEARRDAQKVSALTASRPQKSRVIEKTAPGQEESGMAGMRAESGRGPPRGRAARDTQARSPC